MIKQYSTFCIDFGEGYCTSYMTDTGRCLRHRRAGGSEYAGGGENEGREERQEREEQGEKKGMKEERETSSREMLNLSPHGQG